MLDKLSTQRTFALVGHGGTGKTSVAEMLLYNSGKISRLGSIEEGTTTLDYEPEEIKRRGSIQPGFANYQWKKNQHFLIDLPGDNNFVGDMPYQLSAVDGVIFVLDAVDGVKPLTKKMWSEVKAAQLPGLVFINKMDRERADFRMAYNGLTQTLGIKTVLLFLPIGAESDFRGVVNVLEDRAYFFSEGGKVNSADVPEDMAEQVAELRETAIENIAESDEELMEKYLEEGELSAEEIYKGLSLGVKNGELVPVCAGAALENKAGEFLLDAVEQFLPSPLQRAPWQGENGEERSPSPEEPFSGLVFKTLADPFSGQISVMRVLSGKAVPDAMVSNPHKDSKEKLGQLLFFEGKKQVGVKDEIGPGAIVGVPKLKETVTGDTLCEEKDNFRLFLPELGPTIISYALAPGESGEEDKLFTAVQRLLAEDVTLKLSRNEETGDMLLSGMGQLHIETAAEKIKRRYKVGVELKTPKIPYRETLKGKADVQGRYKKQSGGRGQFGDCWITLEPLGRGEGYEFVNSIVGGVIPKQYIPAVDEGIQEAAEKGVLAGYPMVDFKVNLYDGSYHSVDSSEMAFKIAGSMAFKKAAEKCSPTLLEPIMSVTIYVPDDYMGDVIGDVSSRRGRVQGSDSNNGVTEVHAQVPMAEMLQYARDLRSMTGGQGTFVMDFDHYEECPPHVAEKVIEESRTSSAH